MPREKFTFSKKTAMSHLGLFRQSPTRIESEQFRMKIGLNFLMEIWYLEKFISLLYKYYIEKKSIDNFFIIENFKRGNYQ